MCVRICCEGGFFAVTASYNPTLRNVAADFPIQSESASQHVETRVGAVHCNCAASWLPAERS